WKLTTMKREKTSRALLLEPAGSPLQVKGATMSIIVTNKENIIVRMALCLNIKSMRGKSALIPNSFGILSPKCCDCRSWGVSVGSMWLGSTRDAVLLVEEPEHWNIRNASRYLKLDVDVLKSARLEYSLVYHDYKDQTESNQDLERKW
ncbi:16236_t:CDS:2, partial [Acaulospora colombiana]